VKLILDISSLEVYSNADFLDLVLAVLPRALKRLLGIFLNTLAIPDEDRRKYGKTKPG